MFKLTKRSLPVVLALCLVACGSDPKNPDEGTPPAKLYEDAKDSMDSGNFEEAIRKYELLESRFPYGSYAQQAQLDIAYAYYRQPDIASAIAACDRFIKQYPNHPNVDYAYYLKGLANFNADAGGILALVDEDLAERDQKAARDSFNIFRDLITRFPESRYVPDARAKMEHLVNAMARHEVLVANYYMKRRAPVAAANRAKQVVLNYPNSASLEEALSIMVRAYDQLGLVTLRDDARRVLEKSFPNSRYLTPAKG